VRFLSKLRDIADVTRVFVIAGDLSAPLGPFDDALAIIRSGLLRRYGFRHVGIAGYPEGHQQITDGNLLHAMVDKLAALADAGHGTEIVTQFLFDADTVLAWLTRLRADGVYAPVRIGLPGPTSVQSLLRFAARCGVAVSASVMAKYGVSITRLFSTAKPDIMLNELAGRMDSSAHGIVKVHLYPFGGLAKTAEWAANFAPASPAVGLTEPG
jgi:methylenetetrahydrofolate reductase (NADPH)